MESAKRPVLITVLCIIGLLWSLGSFVSVFSPFIKKISDWAPAVYGIMVALQFISFIGIWYMKRWGVLVFIISFFLKMIFSIQVDDVSYIATPLGAVLIILFLFYYKRMGKEL